MQTPPRYSFLKTFQSRAIYFPPPYLSEKILILLEFPPIEARAHTEVSTVKIFSLLTRILRLVREKLWFFRSYLPMRAFRALWLLLCNVYAIYLDRNLFFFFSPFWISVILPVGLVTLLCSCTFSVEWVKKLHAFFIPILVFFFHLFWKKKFFLLAPPFFPALFTKNCQSVGCSKILMSNRLPPR